MTIRLKETANIKSLGKFVKIANPYCSKFLLDIQILEKPNRTIVSQNTLNWTNNQWAFQIGNQWLQPNRKAGIEILTINQLVLFATSA